MRRYRIWGRLVEFVVSASDGKQGAGPAIARSQYGGLLWVYRRRSAGGIRRGFYRGVMGDPELTLSGGDMRRICFPVCEIL